MSPKLRGLLKARGEALEEREVAMAKILQVHLCYLLLNV